MFIKLNENCSWESSRLNESHIGSNCINTFYTRQMPQTRIYINTSHKYKRVTVISSHAGSINCLQKDTGKDSHLTTAWNQYWNLESVSMSFFIPCWVKYLYISSTSSWSQVGSLEMLIGSCVLYCDHVLLRVYALLSWNLMAKDEIMVLACQVSPFHLKLTQINPEINCIAKNKCPDSQRS